MAAILHFLDQRRLIDSNGISAGGEIAFYLTGTTTTTSIYSDAALTTPLTNPVVVNAGGVVPYIYLDSSVTYRRVITYADGSVDDVDPYIPTSGAWVSTDVSLEQFGGVGDGTTDNTAAFDAFRDYHQTVTGADPDVWVTLHFGAGLTYATKDPAWACGLDRLIVEGNGAVFQNIMGAGESAWDVDKAAFFTASHAVCDNISPAMYTGKGVTLNASDWDYINAASAGATSVTCTTAGDAANYAAGDWVIIAQGVGYLAGQPPCPQQFQYMEVESVNAGTGVVTFAGNAKLNAAYSATLPVYNASFRTGEWPARAIIFKCGPQWNVRQVYRNLTILPSVGAPSIGAYFQGRSIVLDNVTAPGFSFSENIHAEAKDCHFEADYSFEPVDKLVSQALLSNCYFDGTSTGGLNQGGQVTIQNCTFNGTHGTWFNSHYTGCTFNGQLNHAGSDRVTFDSCFTNGEVVQNVSHTLTVDGTTITYSSGTITVPLTSVAGAQEFFHRLKVGRVIYAITGTGYWDRVWIIVQSLSISGSNILIGVSPVNRASPGSPIPNGTVFKITPCEHYYGRNNSGPVSPNTLSNRTALVNGDNQAALGNNLRVTVAPESGATVSEEFWACRGYVEEVRISVERAYTGTTHSSLFFNLSDYAPAFGTQTVSIDLETVGTRVIRPTGSTAALGADVLVDLAFFVSRFYATVSATAGGAPVALSEATNLLPVFSVEVKLRDHMLDNSLLTT